MFFFIISYFLLFVRPYESSFLGSFFVDSKTARSAMARTRRRIRRHEMSECPFLIGRGWKRPKSSGCLQHFSFCWRSGSLTLKLKVKVLFFLKMEDSREKHITCIAGFWFVWWGKWCAFVVTLRIRFSKSFQYFLRNSLNSTWYFKKGLEK